MRSGAVISTISLVLVLPIMISLVASPAIAKPTEKSWRVSPRKAKIANPIAADQVSVDQGKQLYQRECENCHGKTGLGDGPEAADLDKKVPDFTNADMWAQTDGAIRWKIRAGRRPMPSFKKMLSKDEIWHVTNYLRQSFGSAQ